MAKLSDEDAYPIVTPTASDRFVLLDNPGGTPSTKTARADSLSGIYATAAQGATADTATQPADLSSAITTHEGDTDPHGDRAYADGIVDALPEIAADDPTELDISTTGGTTTLTIEDTIARTATSMQSVGTYTTPISSASQARPSTTGPVYWICENGVTPTNAEDGDLIWNADP